MFLNICMCESVTSKCARLHVFRCTFCLTCFLEISKRNIGGFDRDPLKKRFLFSNVLWCLFVFVFPVNHRVESILSLSFSSYFVFVIDEEFEEAYREDKQSPTYCCSVECDEGGEVTVNIRIDDYSGSWWKCSASLLISDPLWAVSRRPVNDGEWSIHHKAMSSLLGRRALCLVCLSFCDPPPLTSFLCCANPPHTWCTHLVLNLTAPLSIHSFWKTIKQSMKKKRYLTSDTNVNSPLTLSSPCFSLLFCSVLQVTDRSVRAVAEHCPELQFVGFMGCPVTSQGVIHLTAVGISYILWLAL